MLFLELHSKSHSPVASNTPKFARWSGELLSVMVGSFQDSKADGFSMTALQRTWWLLYDVFFFSKCAECSYVMALGVAGSGCYWSCPTSVLLCVETSLSCNLTRGNGFLFSSCCLSLFFVALVPAHERLLAWIIVHTQNVLWFSDSIKNI